MRGLLGAPYLADNNIDLTGITEPRLVFRGSPRGRRRLPGQPERGGQRVAGRHRPDRTTLEIWADPALERNIHRVEVDSDSASFSMEIQNIPSANPKTGRITAQSVIAALRKLTGRCAWAPESGRRPARAAAARDTDWTPARQPRSRPARLHQRRK